MLSVHDASEDDYPGIRRIAESVFSADLLWPEQNYRALLASWRSGVRVLRSDGEVTGYYALWPLAADTVQALAAGALHEREIGAENILGVSDQAASALYVCDVCVSGGPAARLHLLRDLYAHVLAAFRQNLSLQTLAAWPFTADGARLCARFAGAVSIERGLVSIPRTHLLQRIERRAPMTKANSATPYWTSDAGEWKQAAQFFARVIAGDPAYISHGEMQTGLSLDGKTWAPNLEERFLAEVGEIDDSRGLVLVRDKQGAIIAAANVTWDFSVADAPFGTLQDLAVEPSIRSGGLGAQVVAFIEAEARRRGAKWLFLESGKNNHRAHSFFERGGFKEISHVFVKSI